MSPLDFDPRNDGYWGDTTATLDWCEQNYEVGKCHSYFVTWNSIKKFAFQRQKWNPDRQQSIANYRWAGTSPSSGTLWPTCPWSYLQSGASTNPSRWLKKGKYFSQHPMKSLQRGLETRYLVSFLALLLVGIGSTMFHMTLQWEIVTYFFNN